MKKIALFLIAAAPVFTAVAQPSKLVNTINYLRDFNSSHEIESLTKAKENIDLASANPETKDMAKTQKLRAEVYVTIFDNDLRLETEKLNVIGKKKEEIIKLYGQPLNIVTTTDVQGASELLDYKNFYFYIGSKGTVISAKEITTTGQKSEFSPNKINLLAYQSASSASLSEAYTACIYGKSVDTKGNYTSDFTTFTTRIASHYENKAIADYNAKKYADALPSFEKAYEINGAFSKSNSSFDVTYSEENGGTAQITGVSVGWSTSFFARKGALLSISAQVKKGNAVTAVIYVNNQIYKKLTSTGDFVAASVNGTLEADANIKYAVYGNGIVSAEDTTTLANCALVADRGAIYDKAKLYYQKMIDINQGFGNTYSSLVNVYLMMKDTVGGMDMLKKGRVAYPNDINLVITETNYFLKTNNSKEALNNLNIALTAKPKDANLYLVRGNIYDNLANPKDAAGKDMEKPKDYNEKLKLAESDYQKAIELKPDYFDAMYNLGVLYNNHGVALNKIADKITDNAKYKEANDLATAEFSKALPVLEKALEVNPKDRNTMYALKQIYARMQLLDKLKAMNEKLKN
jgi:tetratricopeptide (TPR) repeat protein